jgi:hypothetical protein
MRGWQAGVMAWTFGTAWGTAAAGAPPSPVRVRDPFTANHVVRAFAGAQKRLGDTGCARLFDDFEDAGGTVLREKLAALGQTGRSYLGQLFFYDGSARPACRNETVLAHTHVGSRVVFVCGRAFQKAATRDPRLAEVTLIHEALHSLGLGEDPPTSLEITAQVMRRCRR